MNFSQLLNAGCGQSNPLAQIATHVTRDNAFRDQIGGTSTSESRANNFKPLQSFRMKEIFEELRELDFDGPMERQSPPRGDYLKITKDCEFGRRLALTSQEVEFLQRNVEIYAPACRPIAPPLEKWEKKTATNEDELLNIISFHHRNWLDTMRQRDAQANTERCQNKALEISKDFNITKNTQEPQKFKNVKLQQTRFDYEYFENNPMLELSDALEEGKELLAEGRIQKAILCFEAAVRQDETCVEGWKLLGTTWAEDVQDLKAIYAFKRGLSLEPHNLDLLLGLSQSYKNENYTYAAASKLVDWLANHPEYKDIPENFVPEVPHQPSALLGKYTLEEMQSLFLQAARRHPVNPDYELQRAFGLLLSLDREFDKAADCFLSALQVKPNDSRLWNLLGATLAAANKPEEALNALRKALHLDPEFMLCRYNIAMQLIATKNYKEAAQDLLSIINYQTIGQIGSYRVGRTSDKVWSSLRTCVCTLLGRSDLKEALDNKDYRSLNLELNP